MAYTRRAFLAGGAGVLLGAAGIRPLVAGTSAGAAGATHYLLAVSIDGLNTNAIGRLGRAGLPTLHRLMDEGMSTINARTAVEKTVTLPNHAGMLTGRRVKATMGGHGVTINGYSDPTVTVHTLAGRRIDSIFTVAHAAGLGTALFTSKEKFDLFERSWDPELDRYTYESDNPTLVNTLIASLTGSPHELTFLHLSAPDDAGHRYQFMSTRYLDAVMTVDTLLGDVLQAIENDATLSGNLTLLVTADHGGLAGATGHNSRTTLENYRVPFLAWGAGVGAGDLYDANPGFADPGTTLVNYRGTQPIRNAAMANLSLKMLGLGPVPGSGIDAGQVLDVSGDGTFGASGCATPAASGVA